MALGLCGGSAPCSPSSLAGNSNLHPPPAAVQSLLDLVEPELDKPAKEVSQYTLQVGRHPQPKW